MNTSERVPSISAWRETRRLEDSELKLDRRSTRIDRANEHVAREKAAMPLA